eukprot:3601445-Rhodomonas_salina.1
MSKKTRPTDERTLFMQDSQRHNANVFAVTIDNNRRKNVPVQQYLNTENNKAQRDQRHLGRYSDTGADGQLFARGRDIGGRFQTDLPFSNPKQMAMLKSFEQRAQNAQNPSSQQCKKCKQKRLRVSDYWSRVPECQTTGLECQRPRVPECQTTGRANYNHNTLPPTLPTGIIYYL